VKKVGYNRNDCIKILEHLEDSETKKGFLSFLKEDSHFKDIKGLWMTWRQLFALMSQPVFKLKDKNAWNTQVHKWVRSFIDSFGESHMTTYLHILEVHVGDMLERFDGIYRMANFAIEGKHQLDKYCYHHDTARDVGAPRIIMEHMAVISMLPDVHPHRIRKEHWIDKILDNLDGDLAQFRHRSS
jgi:hypothetical protein